MKLIGTCCAVLAILAAAAAAVADDIDFTGHMLASAVSGAMEISIADLDGDGDMDAASTAYQGNEVAWWENDGDQNFTKHSVGTGLTGPRAVRIADHTGAVLDLDGDGDGDILATIYTDNDVLWWENDGAQNFSLRVLTDDLAHAHTADPVDLDGDGDLDIAVCGYQTAWFENDGAANFTRHDLYFADGDLGCFIYGEDLDLDGDVDLLEARESAGDVVIWENDGASNFTRTVIDASCPGVHNVLPRDLDGDGDLDIAGCSSTSAAFYWWERLANGSYLRRTIASALNGAIWVDAGDLDADGDIDLAGACYLIGELNWFENDGAGGFTYHRVSTGNGWVFCAAPADLDGDGDLDIAATSRSASRLTWWESDVATGPTGLIDAAPSADDLLRAVAPNPFNPATVLTYAVPQDGEVRITIHDLRGRLIETLLDEARPAGTYETVWRAEGLASGTYCCRIEAGGRTENRKLTLAK